MLSVELLGLQVTARPTPEWTWFVVKSLPLVAASGGAGYNALDDRVQLQDVRETRTMPSCSCLGMRAFATGLDTAPRDAKRACWHAPHWPHLLLGHECQRQRVLLRVLQPLAAVLLLPRLDQHGVAVLAHLRPPVHALPARWQVCTLVGQRSAWELQGR